MVQFSSNKNRSKLKFIIFVKFAKRQDADANDCLLKKCDVLVMKEIRQFRNAKDVSGVADVDGDVTQTSRCPSQCPESNKFESFFEQVKHLIITNDLRKENGSYHKLLMDRVNLIRINESVKSGQEIKRLTGIDDSGSCLTHGSVSCRRIVADFRFLQDFDRSIASPFNETELSKARPGTLLKMLLSQLDYDSFRINKLFKK